MGKKEPLFACFVVEKLAAFHSILLANRSPPSCLARTSFSSQYAGSRGRPAHTYSNMFIFRSVAFCPEWGLSLLIINNVHYCHHSRLVTAVSVYTLHLSQPHPHSSEPAGRALIIPFLILTNIARILLLASACYSYLIQLLSTFVKPDISLPHPHPVR